MIKDELYLLKPNFKDAGKTYYCPGCAEVLGLMEFYPELKKHVNVHYVDFPRPRPELAPVLGEDNQSCPVLILGTPASELPPNINAHRANGRVFVEGARSIGEYLAHVHQIGIPH